MSYNLEFVVKQESVVDSTTGPTCDVSRESASNSSSLVVNAGSHGSSLTSIDLPGSQHLPAIKKFKNRFLATENGFTSDVYECAVKTPNLSQRSDASVSTLSSRCRVAFSESEHLDAPELIEDRGSRQLSRSSSSEYGSETMAMNNQLFGRHDTPVCNGDIVTSAALQSDTETCYNPLNQDAGIKLKSRWLNRRSTEHQDLRPSASAACAHPVTKSVRNNNLLTVKSQEEQFVEADSSVCDVTMPIPNFTPIGENVFLSERKRSKLSKEDRRMVCECVFTPEDKERDFLGCGSQCLNRMLYVECGSRCHCGEYCSNRRFQKKQYPKLEVYFTGPKGHGLRTKQYLPAGTFIIEYVGEVLSPAQFRSRTHHYAKDAQHAHYYFMALKGEEIIDATQKGNISRFINHSCEPNAETQKWTVGGQLCIGFFTTRNVEAEEEITFDYQFQRYGKAAQKCLCGSSRCRGFIGSNDKQTIDVCTDEDMSEIPSEVVEPRRDRSTRRARTKRHEFRFEDFAFKEQLEELLTKNSMRRKEDILSFCRFMVRAEDLNDRERMLALLSATEENLLHLFLAYHGLPLLHSWMMDAPSIAEDDGVRFRKSVLLLLQKLTNTKVIPDRHQLKKSKLLSLVERWAAAPASPVSPGLVQRHHDSVSDDSQLNSIASSPSADYDDSDLDPDVVALGRHLVQMTCSSNSPSVSLANSLCENTLSDNLAAVESEAHLELRTLAVELLRQWDGLMEFFKIPKRSDNNGSSENGQKQLGNHHDVDARLTRTSALPANRSTTQTSTYNVRQNVLRVRTPSPVADQRERQLLRKRCAAGVEKGNTAASDAKKGCFPQSRRNSLKHLGSTAVATPPYSPMSEASSAHASSKNSNSATYNSPHPEHGGGHGQPIPTHVARVSTDFSNMDEEYMEADSSDNNNPGNNAFNPEFSSSYEQPPPYLLPTAPQPFVTPAGPTAFPAILVHDPNTFSYWWQDQTTRVLVYPAQQEQVEAVMAEDFSGVPHFYFDPVAGLIHEVRLETYSPGNLLPVPTAATSEAQPEPTAHSVESKPILASDVKPDAIQDAKQQIEAMQQELARLKKELAIKKSETGEVESNTEQASSSELVTSAPVAVEIKKEAAAVKQEELPKYWKMAMDSDRTCYYYHLKSRRTQWDFPTEADCLREENYVAEQATKQVALQQRPETSASSGSRSSGQLEVNASNQSVSAAGKSNTAGTSKPTKATVRATTTAADSSADSSEAARKIKEEFKGKISKYVVKGLEPYRKTGRIATAEEFKYLARKLTHAIMEKELKLLTNVSDLQCSKSVVHKAQEFIKKYMTKPANDGVQMKAESSP